MNIGTLRQRIPKNSIMLFSGGLDSLAAWRLLGKPKAIYFAIGHKAEASELGRILAIQRGLGLDIVIDKSLDIGKYEMSNRYIPYRNLFFIMRAALYAPNVIINQIAEWAPDKNKRFYRKTESLLNEIGRGKFQGIDRKVKIWSPFSGMTKTELIREYGKHWPIETLTELTISCYNPGCLPCGQCTSCVSRHVAMLNNRVRERYQTEPDTSKLTNKLNIQDFKLSQTKMYLKRWLELRQFTRMEKEQ